jgi:hypothetical protein
VTPIVVLGAFWLLVTGLLAPMLVTKRRGRQQDKLPTRFDYLRGSSTYRRTLHQPTPYIEFRYGWAGQSGPGSA